MPVSSLTVMGLNPLAQKKELEPKGPSAPKEAVEKFEPNVKNANLHEGNIIKLPLATGKNAASLLQIEGAGLKQGFCKHPPLSWCPVGKSSPSHGQGLQVPGLSNICTLKFSAAIQPLQIKKGETRKSLLVFAAVCS